MTREEIKDYFSCPRKFALTMSRLRDPLAIAVERVLGGDEWSTVQPRDESIALHQALVYGWQRVRLPELLDEYDVVNVGREEVLPNFSTLSTVLRRKSDRRLFIYFPASTSRADDRWLSSWQTDMLLQLECMAVEPRLGAASSGVIVDGFITGKKVPVKNDFGETIGYRQSSPLIYGYKSDGYYDFQHKKNWDRFSVWEEPFGANPISYWVKWLPKEIVREQFASIIVPRKDASRVVTQLIALEQKIEVGKRDLELRGDKQSALDMNFPQNFSSCVYPKRCQFHEVCHGR